MLYKLPFSCYMISPLSDYSVRPKYQNGITSNGEASNEKKPFTTIDDVLRGLVKWLCEQVCDTDTLPFYLPKYSSSAANLGVVNGNINLRYIMFLQDKDVYMKDKHFELVVFKYMLIYYI